MKNSIEIKRRHPGLVRAVSHASAGASLPSQSSNARDTELLDAYSQTIAAVVNRVAPSVVNIRVLAGE
ncbi:MAG: hypothetical protein QOF94_1666, partial [Acidobacteriaceae bacterium]